MNFKLCILSAFLCILLVQTSHGRMLPTRSVDDGMDRLRDILRYILDPDSEHHAPEMKRSETTRELTPDDYRDLKEMISQKAYGSMADERYMPFKRASLPLRLYGTKLAAAAATDEKKK